MPHAVTALQQASSAPSLEAGIPVSRATTIDIEHVLVEDDPRLWSETRKYVTLGLIACASLIATMGVNIYNPAISDIKRDLGATDQDISLSLSLFILVQGSTPLLWSAVSEIKGRKYVYLISILLFTAGCAVGASATRVAVLISMRVLQALGGSAVLAIGAGTLADIYDPRERGTKLGIYYSIPLIGASLGPILGGVLTQVFNWRATFWCLVILGGIIWLAFLVFFKDTFRRERSLTYQRALKRARLAAAKRKAAEREKLGGRFSRPTSPGPVEPTDEKSAEQRRAQSPIPGSGAVTPTIGLDNVKLSLGDVNPFHPLKQILRRKNNIAILVPSALMFAFSYSISYTSVRTLAKPPYNYNALKVGLVLLSFGVGNMLGSIIGGRYSDYLLAKHKADPDRKATPESRLESTLIIMWLLPPSVVLYAWFAQEHLHIAALCVALFLAGLSSIWIYTSTLAYIVDANVGRSSTAVATNSAFRGTAGFVSAEIAVPIQDAIGDSGLYMIWAGLLVVMELLILLTGRRGGKWRERAQEREDTKAATAI
ncbi:MFS general substrate transporter [Exidia glandulosa HHB12029]|uniref:MFS general substrate transporter n=1 Tax=Exidia glandulosa HHB12029 TaxID=1314781 RepID=A0A165QBM4_EXIGL|nr:MFS general substrate transporter [Exidia glandulosa HHB12029]